MCKAKDDSTSPGHGGSTTHDTGAGKVSTSPPVCTYEKMVPQPPAGSELRLGHGASEKGAIYIQTCTLTRDGGTGTMPDQKLVWLAPGQKAPPVDPQAVAQMALAKMKLLSPAIASPHGTGKYVVGMPMWMWVDKTPTTFGPQTASATAGGVIVTATAAVTSISWDMGDGTDPVVCNGPGTKYQPSMGKAPSPDCGHVYNQASTDQRDGKFHGSATATWAVNWAVNGGGQTGTFTEVRQSALAVDVREVQVLN
ncbi:ATP/GTP-binding protein [Streptomyces sp. NPDC046942]|uniref:ATP/GTP-binding protein n=1 Tax=Streptomyces sp. NPDC046942 TaxID=3155137 RepID=UPI0033F54BE5